MGAGRRFVDSFGFSWQALEITRVVAGDDSAATDGWLYFLSRGTTRRLRSYPIDWETLAWADLEELCSRAEVIGSERFRPGFTSSRAERSVVS